MRFLIVGFMMILIIFSGCNDRDNNDKNKNGTENLSTNTPRNNTKQNEKAKLIAKSLMANKNINKAIVVVNGDTALVGIEIHGEWSDKDHYIDLVNKQVRKIDSNISKIEVTTDKTMYARIKKLSEDINDDKPIKGIIDQFLKIKK